MRQKRRGAKLLFAPLQVVWLLIFFVIRPGRLLSVVLGGHCDQSQNGQP